MVRGLYTAASGMINEQQKLDVIANNLANVNTNGYKRDIYTQVPFQDVLISKINDKSANSNSVQIGSLTPGVAVSDISTDYTQGSYQRTNNTLDVAIDGDGFFEINANTPNRTGTFYSRDGSFTLDNNSYLVTKDGYNVVGNNGSIKLDSNSDIVINPNGDILQNGKVVDKIKLDSFNDSHTLKKVGDNLYSATAQAVQNQSNATIRQGYLEASNVNTIKEMINMINTSRTFENNQKVIQNYDSLLDKTVNEVGAVK